jgi:hypothetical protein
MVDGVREFASSTVRLGPLRAAGARLAVPVIGESVSQAKAIPGLPGHAEDIGVVVGVDGGRRTGDGRRADQQPRWLRGTVDFRGHAGMIRRRRPRTRSGAHRAVTECGAPPRMGILVSVVLTQSRGARVGWLTGRGLGRRQQQPDWSSVWSSSAASGCVRGRVPGRRNSDQRRPTVGRVRRHG